MAQHKAQHLTVLFLITVCWAEIHIHAQHIINNIVLEIILLRKTTMKDQKECQVQLGLTWYEQRPYHMSQIKPQVWVTS